MAKHEELLSEGPRTAPEPETAEERSHLRKRGALGGVLAGGAVALKLGVFTKLFIWFAVWHGSIALLRFAGWPGLVVGVAVLTIVIGWLAWYHRRAGRGAASEPQGMSS
jgi:hypothetical protein